MRKDIQPKYYPEALVICSTCGTTWKTGSTMKEIRTDVCSNCHPFYTGEQRMVDTEGQVDRFYKRLQARQVQLENKKNMATAKASPMRPVAEFELGKRATDALVAAGIETAGQFLEKLNLGDQAVLDIDGFGRKSLADAKKRLRQLGYTLPEAEPVS